MATTAKICPVFLETAAFINQQAMDLSLPSNGPVQSAPSSSKSEELGMPSGSSPATQYPEVALSRNEANVSKMERPNAEFSVGKARFSPMPPCPRQTFSLSPQYSDLSTSTAQSTAMLWDPLEFTEDPVATFVGYEDDIDAYARENRLLVEVQQRDESQLSWQKLMDLVPPLHKADTTPTIPWSACHVERRAAQLPDMPTLNASETYDAAQVTRLKHARDGQQWEISV